MRWKPSTNIGQTMQYILTETEYLKLKSEKAVRVGKERDELQAFCTLAANHIPVKPLGTVLEIPG